MNAETTLILVTRILAERRLDAVLIGNAAAAIQGSPVTTMDFAFMFRKTPTTLAKLKRVAEDLGAVVFRPFYPASQLYRITRDRDGLQLDFMARIHGIRSFDALRGRASTVRFGEHELLVAALGDHHSEQGEARAAIRILPCYRFSGGRSMKKKKREPKALGALRQENERALILQIRRLLALPPSRRTNFLRVRLPNGGSAL